MMVTSFNILCGVLVSGFMIYSNRFASLFALLPSHRQCLDVCSIAGLVPTSSIWNSTGCQDLI